MFRLLVILGALVLSLLSIGPVSAAHNEQENVQILGVNEQNSNHYQSYSDTTDTDTTKKKDKCCDKTNDDN